MRFREQSKRSKWFHSNKKDYKNTGLRLTPQCQPSASGHNDINCFTTASIDRARWASWIQKISSDQLLRDEQQQRQLTGPSADKHWGWGHDFPLSFSSSFSSLPISRSLRCFGCRVWYLSAFVAVETTQDHLTADYRNISGVRLNIKIHEVHCIGLHEIHEQKNYNSRWN